MAKYYYNINGEELKLFELNVNSLNTFVTSKNEKIKDKSKSRMPRTSCISIGEYIYGTKNKSIVQKKQATVKRPVKSMLILK